MCIGALESKLHLRGPKAPRKLWQYADIPSQYAKFPTFFELWGVLNWGPSGLRWTGSHDRAQPPFVEQGFRWREQPHIGQVHPLILLC